MQTPRTEFAQALRAIATERGLDASVILETIKQAIIAAYKRDARERGEETEENEYDVELNSIQRLTFLLKEIRETPRGRIIILSRSDPEFVRKLFAREVPEVASGAVEVKVIAREPGVRTKISVFSNQSGVDPVGSCVGQKGVRGQAVN